jgi:hypothetical protein
MKYLFGIALLLICASLCAQENAKDDPLHPIEPTIAFDRYWEPATPQEFSVTVKASGAASYLSRNPTRIDKESHQPDPDYIVKFTLSPANLGRLFVLARQTNYFQGDFEFKHKVADTGKKTLTYADPARHSETLYNFSENKNIDEITKMFQGISMTIEHGRKLEFMHRFDKLGLEDELRSLEDMAKAGELSEIRIIAPVLHKIADDNAVLHIARQRAQGLLAMAGTP